MRGKPSKEMVLNSFRRSHSLDSNSLFPSLYQRLVSLRMFLKISDVYVTSIAGVVVLCLMVNLALGIRPTSSSAKSFVRQILYVLRH